MSWEGVAPSILAADFSRLGAQVEEVLAAGASVIHVDVMDGHFVPPITMGPLAVNAIADTVHAAGGVIDVHLMIERPERQIEEFAKAGADGITLHLEATPHVNYALAAVREAGCRAGLALNPHTLAGIRGRRDRVHGPHPLHDGEPWMGRPGVPARRRRPSSSACAPFWRRDTVLEVDGGIAAGTAATCAKAGASLFVAGSAVFGADDPGEAVREIANAIEGLRAGSH